MLMRTPFLTAEELGLDARYYKGMLITLEKLESGALVFAPVDNPTVPNGFNMAQGWASFDCGTVACIAGWATHFSGWVGCGFTEGRTGYEAHYDLTCPPNWRDGKYTVEQAAHALRSYLTTGKADWELEK